MPTDALTTFLTAPTGDDATFQQLALRLFAHQFEHNAPYRRLCVARGKTPETVVRWQDIPAVPAAAFKRFALTCTPEAACTPEQGGRVFHSSGTTSAETSRHFMDAAALATYRLALTEGYRRFIPAEPVGIVTLVPQPSDAPHSSLALMLETLGAQFLTPEPLATWLTVARKPVCCFTTAFSWVHFFDAYPEQRWQLPEGSVVIETGGFKGRSREVAPGELYALFTERLGVPPERCFAEYGMSELASQFYSVGPEGVKYGPHWIRTRVIDPVTGDDAPLGTPGLLAHYDLANTNSCLAIQTEDLGVAQEGGGFRLLGRAPGAVLRGCSLLSEVLL